MASSHLSVDSLPNEILINVLSSFDTRSLLPLAAVCHRFRGLVGRVHYARLIEATVLKDHEVILECYHPCDKLSTPSLFCEYLGTDGLSEAGDVANLGQLNSLYARFRPYLGDGQKRQRNRGPPSAMIQKTEEPAIEPPTHEVHLESGELFSQLCTVTDMVKVGPRRGLFLSIANVTDGVIRVWRDWLQKEAEKTAKASKTQQRARTSMDDILWTDSSKNVGLKFRVTKDESLREPVLFASDEDPPVSYSLEYQELFIRTNQLRLSYETSEAQQQENHTGKAIVIASSM
ncbi:hypothetical protein F5B20DRAFT_52708 [Whalleya microplaca]|nr:hypothetical protein F5B20DRAFT_52708 [Whalleya microplaca]